MPNSLNNALDNILEGDGGVDLSALDKIMSKDEEAAIGSILEDVPSENILTSATGGFTPEMAEEAIPEILGSKKLGAYAVGAGHAAMFLYHGSKQMLGIDEESMKQDEKYMDALYGSDLGGYAIAGAVTETIADPLSLMIPGSMLAKSESLLTKSQMAIRAAAAAGKGAAMGAVYAGAGYVNEEKGETRLGNMALGGTIGAFIGAGSNLTRDALSNRAIKKATDLVSKVEQNFAQKILDGKAPEVAMDELKTEMPKLDKELRGASRLINKKPKLAMNQEQAEAVVDFYSGLRTAPVVKPGGAIDDFVGIMSTRLKEHSDVLHGRLIVHDSNEALRTQELIERVDPFVKAFDDKFSKLKTTMNPELATVRNGLKAALLNSDSTTARNLLNQYVGPEAVKHLDEVYKVTQETGQELVSMGILKQEDLVKDYFPRFMVKKDEFFASLGKDANNRLQNKLAAANTKMIADAGRALTPLEEGMVIDKALRGYPRISAAPSFTKERKINKIPEKFLQYYADPGEAIHTHINESIRTIEKWKFFGRDNISITRAGGVPVLNTEKSVGMLLQKELANKNMDPGSLKEINMLLNARFGLGEKSPTGWMQDGKNITYALTMANPFSAAMQLGDVGATVHINGMKPTLKATVKTLLGRSDVTAKEFGFVDRLSEEFVSTRATAKFTNKMFKWSGFSSVDRFSKAVNLQAGLEKFRSQALKDPDLIRSRYGAMLGKDLEKTILDLKDGKVTQSIKAMLWDNLARFQPISKSEMPVRWLNHPDGRVGYMYKSFALKQLDMIRRDAVNEIKKGNVGTGLKNLTSIGITLGMAGAGAEKVTEFMSGRNIEDVMDDASWDDIPKNLFKTFGWGETTTKHFMNGEFTKVVTDIVVPPYDLFDRMQPLKYDEEEGFMLKDEDFLDRATRNLPLGGKAYYMWFGGGLEALEERKERERE